ncbi:aspartate aminotransferase family protein [Exilibacterium tricleocarpae]|uniref:Acetylornithine aminotransferase n=1 Tax=Exilibacterium tricleocarpae TaxID=2591008 RepID=A0A545U5M2_9GAMM|nr:aspartate aminotransferase family protein [Exilibacterium tricleocarpae]TQV84762.1 aspartate aminotransferase family protein [Exilibacterium tricleocarpae]
MSSTALMNTYGDRTTTLVKGEGARLWDDRGNCFLDALSGIAVCGLGHSHPAVTRAISEQAATLVHTSNLFNIEPQQRLAQKLRQVSGMDNAFFSNSGAEANEAAIKLARKYGNDRGIPAPAIVVMENSFHGRTLATLSATGNPKVQHGFEPLVTGFVRVPFNDITAIETVAADNNSIVAVLVEPIQGEGGVRVPAGDYLQRLRQLCDRHRWLLMLDEIQTGNGRTGKFFAFQHSGITPDVVTTAKGLGNGVPIGVCLAAGAAGGIFQPGNHGSTFGGNPLACRVAETVIDTLLQPSQAGGNLIDRANQLGGQMLAGLREALGGCATVADIRGRGLMLGIELKRPCGELVERARQHGLIINVTAGNTVRLLPPFILSDAEAGEIVEKVSALVKAF